jgi:hypothetical protein
MLACVRSLMARVGEDVIHQHATSSTMHTQKPGEIIIVSNLCPENLLKSAGTKNEAFLGACGRREEDIRIFH